MRSPVRVVGYTGVELRYQATPIWDVSFGGRRIDGLARVDSFFNDFQATDFNLQIGRSF